MGEILTLWGEVLDAVRTGDRSRIEDRIDWAIKLRLLEDYRARHDLDWGSPRLAQLDLAFHDIDPDRGLFRMLRRRGAVARLLPEDAARSAVETAPPTTRARVRADFVARAREHGLDYAVDWTTLKLTDHPLHAIVTKDPFDTSSAAVDRLFGRIA